MTEPAVVQPLKDAAIQRSLSAAKRARRAMRELDKRGAAINFVSVAAAANVSRQFLYTHDELRVEIEQLRDEERQAPVRLPARARASDASVRARLRAALDDNQRLREQNTRLRDELALAHGRVRDLELGRRTGQIT